MIIGLLSHPNEEPVRNKKGKQETSLIG